MIHIYLSALSHFYKEHSLAHSPTSHTMCGLYVPSTYVLSHLKAFTTLQCVNLPIYLTPPSSDHKPYENTDFILCLFCARTKHNDEPLYLLNEWMNKWVNKWSFEYPKLFNLYFKVLGAMHIFENAYFFHKMHSQKRRIYIYFWILEKILNIEDSLD